MGRRGWLAMAGLIIVPLMLADICRCSSGGTDGEGAVPWWVYLVIITVLSGGVIGIIASTYYYRGVRQRAREEARMVSAKWTHLPTVRMFPIAAGMLAVTMGLTAMLTFMVRVGVGLNNDWTAVVFVIILVLTTAPILYIISTAFTRGLAARRREYTDPLDYVAHTVDGALLALGIRYERFSPDEYRREGANRDLRRSIWLMESGGSFIYDLKEDGQLIRVFEQTALGTRSTYVIIHYVEFRDERLVEALTLAIDRYLP